jgi:ribosomal protein S18 acetylase RimI-like enzyme
VPEVGDRSNLAVRGLTLLEVRASAPIPSGYTSDSIFRLIREAGNADGLRWRLREERLSRPITKSYDEGAVDEWLPLYTDTASVNALRFLGAYRGPELVGLATWTATDWNNALWLVDIRVHTDHRRHGIGSILIQSLQQEAAEAGRRGIRVETQTTNETAIRFYLKHGFEVSGFDDHLYTNRDLERGEVGLFLFWQVEH